jgi:hypothetical protein
MSLSDAYPISAPAAIVDVGTFWFAHTGDAIFQNVGDVRINPTGSVFIHSLSGSVNFSGSTIRNFATTGSGQIIYSADGVTLAPIPIGTDGQFLKVVSGQPVWQTLASQGPLFSAFSTGATTAITGATTWQSLTGSFAQWSVSVTGGVTDTSFSTGSGTFTVPASSDGVYEVCAAVGFQADNRGSSTLLVSDADLPGRATRQIRILKNGTDVLAANARQAEASATNPTQVDISNCKVALTSGDTVVVQVRHDSPNNLAIISGSARRSFFSVSRVR